MPQLISTPPPKKKKQIEENHSLETAPFVSHEMIQNLNDFINNLGFIYCSWRESALLDVERTAIIILVFKKKKG